MFLLNMTSAVTYKKNREGNKFSSRVEVRVVTPKKFGAVNTAWGLVPLFLRCFWRARDFLRFAITKQNQQLIFVGLHCDTCIVRDDDIAILFAQFFRGVCFEVIRFSGEP